MAVPEFYLSANAKLFVMRRFDRDEQLNPIGFEDMAALMGLGAEQKYSKSYSAIAKAIRLFCPAQQVQNSLAQLFAIVTLSCIVGNGDAHLKNFGLLYSDPTQRDARLAPAYDIVNTTAYIPEDVLALTLAGNKSMFASRQGLLDFAETCGVAQPGEIIRKQLQALDDFASFNRANLARDRDGDYVFMAKSPWDVSYQVEKNPQLTFSATKER